MPIDFLEKFFFYKVVLLFWVYGGRGHVVIMCIKPYL